jgi:hypothetical protein
MQSGDSGSDEQMQTGGIGCFVFRIADPLISISEAAIRSAKYLKI